jgi:hypothetical protein
VSSRRGRNQRAVGEAAADMNWGFLVPAGAGIVSLLIRPALLATAHPEHGAGRLLHGRVWRRVWLACWRLAALGRGPGRCGRLAWPSWSGSQNSAKRSWLGVRRQCG